MTNQHPADLCRVTGDVGAAQAEPYRTIAEAAKELGVHTWALRRAINNGSVPAYTPFNSRRRVRISEVVAAIVATKIGGVV